MSRSDIARELNLTRTTVGNAVKVLLESELVHEPAATNEAMGGADASRVGRPSVGIELNPSGAYFVGLDISTSSLTAVLIDFSMKIVAQFSSPLGHDAKDVEAVADQLAELAKRAILAAGKNRDKVRGIGVSIPGLVGRDGRVAIAPFLQWRNIDLKAMMEERLGTQINIRICNDAAALASAVLSTVTDAENHDFLLVLMSEGIGSAIVRQGRVMDGYNGFAGEIGQMVMAPTADPGSPKSFQLNAGSRFLASHLSRGRLTAESILEVAGKASESPKLHQILEQWAAHLAAGFLNAIWLLDPERIVVGGMLAPLYPRAAARVEAILTESMPGLRVPPVLLSQYGAEGAAVGAAAVIRETMFALPDMGDPGGD